MDEIFLQEVIHGPVGVQGTRIVEAASGRVVATCADPDTAAELAGLINARLAEERKTEAN